MSKSKMKLTKEESIELMQPTQHKRKRKFSNHVAKKVKSSKRKAKKKRTRR